MAATAFAVLRPRDEDALRGELRTIAARGAAPVVFAGEVQDDILQLSEFMGTRTTGLKGLSIPPHSGLGGRAVAQRAPISVHDYRRSSTITHHYDRPVLTEGLRSVLAVPVVVGGKARAVLYAASRECAPIGDRTANLVVAASRRLSTEISIRDEVDRRLQMLATIESAGADGATTEELRDIHADLRAVAQHVADTAVRSRLHELSDRIAALRQPSNATRPGREMQLTPREIDVLAHVALGCTNSEIAQRLSVGPQTVKSYLRAAMNKLSACSRQEAVVTARKFKLLP
ncbi:probable transcriptional regulator, LuxR family protein (plasmid) [Rhodococcus jostii RHA1]|uniref:Probable transcriptional regulator, LuxR family protein n=1 Tax=Rhodococcus jostii (strain RHA1) TaxID=101510 RepID=Q0S001_RHOJR|nr:LuxR C-terminal-related transcriptional regulator [Rhodococcus jostii]ABG99135.1 probable transcriptional regulator, LuxR family protein [Rhodococcus jostii RHA1]